MPAAEKPSAGQVVLDPVQDSATSQAPAEARQVVPALPAGCAGTPLWQMSRVQGLESILAGSVRAVPSAFLESVGQEAPAPVQDSPGSHSLVEARQEVPAAENPSAGQVMLDPVQDSATSQVPAEARQVVGVKIGDQAEVDRAGSQMPQEPLVAFLATQAPPIKQKSGFKV